MILKVPKTSSRKQHGFMLMEVVIALSVFAIACTGLVVALHQMADTASNAQRELKITRILDSALAEQLSFPTLQEGTTQIPIEGTDIELDVVVKPIEDLKTKDDQILQEMYHIHITANWYFDGKWHSRTAETWRYNMMYQP